MQHLFSVCYRDSFSLCVAFNLISANCIYRKVTSLLALKVTGMTGLATSGRTGNGLSFQKMMFVHLSGESICNVVEIVVDPAYRGKHRSS
jgi:hypothetical protein